ncbi:MAG: insulinase family protein [Lentisphaeria bacterium]|nr:insulinase family protein [Lentisphaeria bacterium]
MSLPFDIGSVFHGFHIDSVADVPDAGGRLWRMTYEKNGAELVWLDRADEVKTFVIAFKTLPEDDTGVAHILEHSVLAGSEKYPVKSPFDEMRKSSVCVFMNAMTSRDATYYPFSTRNDTDLLNLADVYLDAVFHPLVLKDPMAFRQEGWHHELSDDQRELSVNGVVFNEMKGVFASPDNRAYRDVMSALYPDIVYGHDSGGRPEKIPELTYEDFRDFHRRFYHPSNARVFLDGSVKIAEVLEKLDAFLSPYERQEVRAEIGLQAPVEICRRIPYASAAVENKAILALGWSVGTMRDPSYSHAVDVLADYLCGSNEAPLKKALLEQRVCKDAAMGCYDYRQIPLFLILKDTSEENFGAIRKVVHETLEQICRDGIDLPRVLSLIDRDEFAEREMNSRRPKGLAYFSRAVRLWLYGGEPSAALDTTGIYGQLRSGAESGLFERIIRERILENRHRAEIGFLPDPTLAERKAAEDRAVLESLRRKLTPDELRTIAGNVSALKAWQGRDDPAEDIAGIPRIASRDLPPCGSPAEGTVKTSGGVTRIVSRPTAAGVFYLELYFPVNDLPADDLVRLPLFARLLGKLGTARHSAFELQTLIAANIGRVSCSTASAKRGRYFKVSVAALAAKAAAALELVKEVLWETQFDDAGEIEKILRQKQIAAEREAANDGRVLALRAARRALAERWAAADILYGERQLRWLQEQKTDDDLISWCRNMPARLLKRDGLIISHTDNLPEGLLDLMLAGLDPGKRGPAVHIPMTGDRPCAFSIDGDTGFSAWVAPLPENMRTTGPMRVAARILSLGYLHREVREIGGAYGVHMNVTPNGLVECTSYRDPSPFASLKKMNGTGPALRAFVDSGFDIDRFVVATVASMEPYRPPADSAVFFADLYMDERTPEDEERIRHEVLSTTKAHLLRFAELLDSISSCVTTCVVGGERQVRNGGGGQIRPIIYR